MQNIQNIVNYAKEDEIKLRKNFIDACQNTKFLEYAKTLNTSGEVLMKYTSSLEDASVEFNNCKNCEGLECCKNQILGYILRAIPNGNKINFEYIACPYMQNKIKNEAYLENIELFQTSKSLKEANIKKIKTNDKDRLQILRHFKEFLDHYDDKDKPKGLYLHGSFGTGKTYLIASLFNELAKRNIKSAIVYYPEFLRSLKESFETDYKEKFSYIRRVPVLLIDDIGAEALSSWNRDEILGSILQYRMEEDLPTFFTSNLTLEELEEHLSLSNRGVEKVKARRIIERIRFMCYEMQLISKNRRIK